MESVVIIERPVEEVFGFVLDLSNIPSTDPSVRSVEKTSEGPIDAGTTFRMRQEAPPLRKVRESTVRYTTVEPNRKIEFEAMVGPISPTASLTFEQANGATKVTFRGEPNPVGPFKMLSPLISRQGQRMWEKRLAGLKNTLETREGYQPQGEDRQPQREVAASGARLARALGWVSIEGGTALVAAPGPLMRTFGLGDRPNLGRFLGVRDLVIGTGLLRAQNTAGWCRLRGIADALDATLIIVGVASGVFRRDRAPIGVASGAGFGALSFWLARRLEQR
jgi:carbon monoxide dehydrogenase subunit G